MFKLLRHRATAGLMAIAVMLSNIIVPVTPAFATTQPGTYQPIWCHRTGNHWSVQIGDLNSGDRNDAYALLMTDSLRALVDNKGDEVVDSSITNGSQAYAHDRNAKIDPSFCDTQYPPLTVPTPIISPICGLKNDSVSAINSPSYTWSFNGWTTANPTVTFEATSPYTFVGGSTTVVVPVTESNTNTNCSGTKPTDIHETRQQSTTICAPGGGGLTTTWTEQRTYTYLYNIWTGKWVGYYTPWIIIADSLHTMSASDEDCPRPVQVQPNCEITTGSLTLPAFTEDKYHSYSYKVTINGITTTYSAAHDVEINTIAQGAFVQVKLVKNTQFGGLTVYTHAFTFNYANCIDIPDAPAPNDPCGLRNATWELPADTNDVHWSITDTGHLIATAIGGTFTDGTTTHDYGTAQDSNVLCEATPIAPTPVDYCYTDRDYISLPWSEGVIYEVNGAEVYWSVPYDGTDITITAVPANNYAFPVNAQSSWTFTAADFSNEQCLTITKSAKVGIDTNVDGKITAGDKVQWTITVTNTSKKDYESFYVTVDDQGAVLDQDGFIGYLAAGESVTLTATSVITNYDMLVCKVTNTATLSGWRAYELERVAMANEKESTNEEFPLATASASATYPLDCNPGKGSTASSSTPTPELPHTGPISSVNYLLLGLLSAVTIYGALYFAQPKKFYE